MSRIIDSEEFKIYFPGIPSEVRDSHEALRASLESAKKINSDLIHRQNINKVQLTEAVSFIKSTPCECPKDPTISMDSCYRCETLNSIEKLGAKG